jgi:hypothetical protein
MGILEAADKMSGVPSSPVQTAAQIPRLKITPMGEYALENQEVKPGLQLDALTFIRNKHMPTAQQVCDDLKVDQRAGDSVIKWLIGHRYVQTC